VRASPLVIVATLVVGAFPSPAAAAAAAPDISVTNVKAQLNKKITEKI